MSSRKQNLAIPAALTSTRWRGPTESTELETGDSVCLETMDLLTLKPLSDLSVNAACLSDSTDLIRTAEGKIQAKSWTTSNLTILHGKQVGAITVHAPPFLILEM